jgi:taurine dioxygenase
VPAERETERIGEVRDVEIVRLTGAIGAEVKGVDLRAPLDAATVATLRVALLHHLVLFFREQELTPGQQLVFAAQFGTPVLPMGGEPPSGADIAPYFNVLEDMPDNPPKADFWHTDVAFLRQPPDIAVLCMEETPPIGGDTSWLSLYALYEELSLAMQELVSQLDLDLHLGQPFRRAVTTTSGEEEYRRIAATVPVMRHPLVRIHPETGRRALYMCGAFMEGISGMAPDESAALLDFLRSKLANPNLAVRWRWQRHDVVMWDERCTNHRANSDHGGDYRRVRRCLVGCSVPVGPRGPGGHIVPPLASAL